MNNKINYLVKNARIYSLLEKKYSSPVGPYADIIFFDDFLVFLTSDENSKESETGALGSLFGLLGMASTHTIDAIINKYKNIQFNKSLSGKLDDFDHSFFASYNDITCTLEEEKKPSFMSFMYAQNTWICFSGKFQIKKKYLKDVLLTERWEQPKKKRTKKLLVLVLYRYLVVPKNY
jgi:hypothetical protein